MAVWVSPVVQFSCPVVQSSDCTHPHFCVNLDYSYSISFEWPTKSMNSLTRLFHMLMSRTMTRSRHIYHWWHAHRHTAHWFSTPCTVNMCVVTYILHNTYCSLSKRCPPPFSLKVFAKGHLLLESMPTQQTKIIICSKMFSAPTPPKKLN